MVRLIPTPQQQAQMESGAKACFELPEKKV
jgi:hypothetical protein